MTDVLLVDDDEPLRTMLREMLERAGYRVREAANGQLALRVDSEEPSAIVLVDLVMPEKEGLETIRELRRRRPDVKIVAMSGGGRMNPSTSLAAARSFGAAWTLTKPFSRSELLLALERTLGQPDAGSPAP